MNATPFFQSLTKGYYRRDRLICWLCNRLMRLASPRYRATIAGAIEYGLSAAARDVLNGTASPARWQTYVSAPAPGQRPRA